MILGEVRRCFFQELRLHLQLTVLPLEFLQPRAFGHRQWRLDVLAGVVTPIRIDPVTQSSVNNTQFPRDDRDRSRRATIVRNTYSLQSMVSRYAKKFRPKAERSRNEQADKAPALAAGSPRR